jgi:hypothetical protein
VLGPTVGVAVVLAVSALSLWGVALWLSWGGDCPGAGSQNAGLGRGVSAWPPAAQCLDSQGNAFWHQALPWATWVVGLLIAAAAAVLLTGLIVAIRDLRRPVPAASPRAGSLRWASFPPGGPDDGRPLAVDEAADAERDPPAMAA